MYINIKIIIGNEISNNKNECGSPDTLSIYLQLTYLILLLPIAVVLITAIIITTHDM